MTSIRRIVGVKPLGRTPPRQPDYPEELTPEQIDAIRKLAGCKLEDGYKPLFAPAW